MDPTALVADIGHFEQEGIQSRLADAVLEEGLVGERRATGHHHPVEV